MTRAGEAVGVFFVSIVLALPVLAFGELDAMPAKPYAWYRPGGIQLDEDGRVLSWKDHSENERNLFSDTGNMDSAPVVAEHRVTGAKPVAFSGRQYLRSGEGWGVLPQPSTIVVASRIYRTSGGYLFDAGFSGKERQALFAGDSSRLSRWQMWAGRGLIHDELAMTHHVQIHTAIFDGERSRHYVDGRLVTSGSAGGQGLAGLTLGGRHDLRAGTFLHGEIAEVMVFRGAISDCRRVALEREMAEKYLPRDLVDVFVSGEDGYHTFRIPVLLATKRGTLLAFAEGRSRRSDQSKNDIVLRRSEDGGETWQPLTVIADHGDDALNDPTVVQERETGRIFLFFHRYPFGHYSGNVVAGLEGEGTHQTFLAYSDDDGRNWSEQKNITRSVKRSAEVTYLGSGPGIGIQLEASPHAGRLVIPFRQHEGVFSVFSDDRGESWQFGDLAENIRPGVANEPQMVELDGGRVMLNARNAGGEGFRKVAVSEDGGATWGTMWHDEVLVEPECQASLLRVSGSGRDPVLLYLNPATREKGDGGRREGLLRASFDGGKSWSADRMVYQGQFSYSAMAAMNGEAIGVLFERDFGLYWIRQRAADHGKDPMRISFRRVSLRGLLNGKEEGQK